MEEINSIDDEYFPFPDLDYSFKFDSILDSVECDMSDDISLEDKVKEKDFPWSEYQVAFEDKQNAYMNDHEKLPHFVNFHTHLFGHGKKLSELTEQGSDEIVNGQNGFYSFNNGYHEQLIKDERANIMFTDARYNEANSITDLNSTTACSGYDSNLKSDDDMSDGKKVLRKKYNLSNGHPERVIEDERANLFFTDARNNEASSMTDSYSTNGSSGYDSTLKADDEMSGEKEGPMKKTPKKKKRRSKTLQPEEKEKYRKFHCKDELRRLCDLNYNMNELFKMVPGDSLEQTKPNRFHQVVQYIFFLESSIKSLYKKKNIQPQPEEKFPISDILEKQGWAFDTEDIKIIFPNKH